MPELTIGQYSTVYNMFSFTIASMFASFVFFVLARDLLSQKYKISMILSALVVGIAGYHYIRILGSWEGAYQLVDGIYVATGKPFNDAYRYVDWLLTVPLLMAELIAVLALTPAVRKVLTADLMIAAVLMIILGYPGEIMDEKKIFGMYGVWGTLSTIPFVYILYVLWVELGKFMKDQPATVNVLVRNIRLLTVATWGFYPIAYIIGAGGGGDSAGAEIGLQVGYTIADVLAKCGYGLMIYHIARAKMEAEGDLLATNR
ncbi:MAG: bacteriorhodopsin-like [Puniceicoccaceae bacterium]